MLVKFISEYRVVVFPRWIRYKGKIYTNKQAEEIARTLGWKDLVEDERPEYDPETQYITYYYEDGETEVFKRWKINDIEPEPNKN